MSIEKINLVYFSPTNTTRKTIESVAKGIEIEQINLIDITTDDSIETIQISKNELTIFGAPVYGGRIPQVSVERFKRIITNGSLAIVVGVYGNRAFDDALIELKHITESNGFKIIGAGAFIGEHAFSFNNIKVAKNRPDENDLQLAYEFGQHINLKIHSKKESLLIDVPGNIPYKKLKERPVICPDTIHSDCILCGDCVTVCPTGAISLNEKVETEEELCIWCCACVKYCKQNARTMDNSIIVDLQKWLAENYTERREPELFL